MSVGVRSVRWQVLNMFKTFHRTERTKGPLRVRYVYVWCPLVSVLSGTRPLHLRWLSVAFPLMSGRLESRPDNYRTWNGQNGDITDEYRTPTEEKRIYTDETVRLTDTERIHRRCTEHRPEMKRIKRTTNGHERRPTGQYKCHLSCSK